MGKNRPRPGKVPPCIPLKYIRAVAGITLDTLIDRIEEETGHRYTRGALSAVENGHRGASVELLESLEVVYGLPAGAIDTAYAPRHEAQHRSVS